MEALLALLSQPLTQLGGLIGVLYALQKAGIDVKGAISGGLGVKANNHEIDADNRSAMQALLSKLQTDMSELSLHFNHETTDNQKNIQDGIGKILEQQSDATQVLKEIKEYGIKCRKD